MKHTISSVVLAFGLLSSFAAFAQKVPAAPAGSTGMCKDGTYTSNETRKGACAGHKGVKDWFAPAAADPAAKPDAAAAAKAPEAKKTEPKKVEAAESAKPAAGGAPGQVWVNSNTKVYHCSGTRYYGKTKTGEYMTEAAAKAAGNHADHGKACAS